MLAKQKHRLLFYIAIGDELRGKLVSEVIDDGIVLEKIQSCPDEKKTYRWLVYFPFTCNILHGGNSRAYKKVPGSKQEPFLYMCEKMNGITQQGPGC